MKIKKSVLRFGCIIALSLTGCNSNKTDLVEGNDSEQYIPISFNEFKDIFDSNAKKTKVYSTISGIVSIDGMEIDCTNLDEAEWKMALVSVLEVNALNLENGTLCEGKNVVSAELLKIPSSSLDDFTFDPGLYFYSYKEKLLWERIEQYGEQYFKMRGYLDEFNYIEKGIIEIKLEVDDKDRDIYGTVAGRSSFTAIEKIIN